WDLNHFVVLESADKTHATILDPARGRRRIPLAKFGRHFTGVALELLPTADFKPIEARTKTRLSVLWSRLSNYRGPFTQVLLLAYFERRHVGDLLSRIGSISPIQSLLTKGIVNMLIDSVLLLTTIIVMLLISPALTGIVLAATVTYVIVNQLLYPALRRRTE